MSSDTICACATSLPSPVAVLRISGPDTLTCFNQIWPNYQFQPRVITPVRVSVQGLSDHAMIWAEKGPKTFTGEDYGEIMVHGGLELVSQLLKHLISRGLRQARPGEFSYRAYMNGKCSVMEALSIGAVLNSETQQDLDAVSHLKNNRLHSFMQHLKEQAIELFNGLQMILDYSEQGYESGEIIRELHSASHRFEKGLSRVRTLLCPLVELAQTETVVIAGKPNVGKSTLFNHIVGFDRVLVSAFAGTTRDYVHFPMTFEDKSFHLVDTAGIRETVDPVEQMGITGTLDCLESACGIIYLIDVQTGVDEALEALCAKMACPIWVFGNKADLVPGHVGLQKALSGLVDTFPHVRFDIGSLHDTPSHDWLPMLSHVTSCLGNKGRLTPGAFPEPIRLLCEELMTDASHCLKELAAEHYDMAQVLLEKLKPKLALLTGEVTDEDIYDQLFSSFCLGK